MSEYNLTLGEALRFAVDEGKVIEWKAGGVRGSFRLSPPHGIFINGYDESTKPWRFCGTTRYRTAKEPVKMVTRYRAARAWHKGYENPTTGRKWYVSKELYFGENRGAEVLQWDIEEQPLNRDDWGE